MGDNQCPCCPLNHPLRLADARVKVWRCDGAIIPRECVGTPSNMNTYYRDKVTRNVINTIKQNNQQPNISFETQSIDAQQCAKNLNEQSCHETKQNNDAQESYNNTEKQSNDICNSRSDVTNENEDNTANGHGIEGVDNSHDTELTEQGETNVTLALLSDPSIRNEATPRYRCEENCDFDLCDLCWELVKNINADIIVSDLESGVEEMVLCLRQAYLRQQIQIPPFTRNSYKHAIHLSGFSDTKLRCNWLLQRFYGGDPEINAPLFVKGDVFDENLLQDLQKLNAGFTTDAYKKALYFSGNKDIESAMLWLTEHMDDPLLNDPVNKVGKCRKCPKGHFLKVYDRSSEQWICEGEDDEGGCQRKVTSENYMVDMKVVRFVCEKTWCSFNLCDHCVLKSVSISQTAIDANEEKDKESDENGEQLKKSGSIIETFQFVNLNNEGPTENLHFDRFEPWADAIVKETKNAYVISHHLFKTPLKSLPAGKVLMNIKFPGKDHHLHHQYIVLGLKSPSGKTFFLSAEKGRSGISVQVHNEFDQVAKYHLGELRLDPIEIEARELTGIHRLEYVELPAIGNLFNKWEVMPQYDLWGSNCQTLAGDVRNRILKASNGLELHLPGTNMRASINDSAKLIPYFQNRFPGWKKKRLVRVPELQFQYAILIEQDKKSIPVHLVSGGKEKRMQNLEQSMFEEEYKERLVKQLGFEGVCKALDGKAFKNDTKAIFFHVTKEKSEAALMNTPLQQSRDGEKSFPEIISEFWKDNFEFISITLDHGIFIFQYQNDLLHSKSSPMESKAEMLQNLGDFKTSCVTTIYIDITPNLSNPELSEPVATSYGYHYNINVTASRIEFDMKFIMQKIASFLEKKICLDKKTKLCLKHLVTKITLLQNLDNETNLIHHKLDNQEWGKSGVMLWTEAQNTCIFLGQKAFHGLEKPLRLIIRGCQGSGKTLVVMKLAKEFVMSQATGNFLISLDPRYTQLKSDLRKHIFQDQSMCGRVLVGAFYHHHEIDQFKNVLIKEMDMDEDKADAEFVLGVRRYQQVPLCTVSVFCYDEAELSGGSRLQENYENILRCMKPSQHIVLASSKQAVTEEKINLACKEANLDIVFQEVNLEGNLRSAPPISSLTTKYQVISIANTANIPVKTSLQFEAPPPKIKIVRSDDRVEFIDSIIQEVRDSQQKPAVQINVLCLCHLSLAEMMKMQLRPEEQKQVSFRIPDDILGCQFPLVVLAIDLATIAGNFQYITDMLTRATAIIKCVINTSFSPYMINELPSFVTTQCSINDVPSFFREMLTKCKGPIFAIDVDVLIPKILRSKLDSRIDFEWWMRRQGESEQEVREKTRKAAVLVNVTPPKDSNSYCYSCYSPVIEFVVLEAHEKDCSRNYDKDYRKPVFDFFTKYR